MNEKQRAALAAAYTSIVATLAEASTFTEAERENLVDSGPRIARGVTEMLWSREAIVKELKSALRTVFPVQPVLGMGIAQLPIIVGPITTTSLCPHHLLPIVNTVHVAYVKQGRVIGLSKLPRIVDALARRAVVQEQYGQDIMRVLRYGEIGDTTVGEPLSDSVAVNVNAVHHCMVCRGVRGAASTNTTEVTGDMRESAPFTLFTQFIAGNRHGNT